MAQNKIRKGKTDSTHRFVCWDQTQGSKLYGYHNYSLAEQEMAEFEEHLLFCFDCQDALFNLETENDELQLEAFVVSTG